MICEYFFVALLSTLLCDLNPLVQKGPLGNPGWSKRDVLWAFLETLASIFFWLSPTLKRLQLAADPANLWFSFVKLEFMWRFSRNCDGTICLVWCSNSEWFGKHAKILSGGDLWVSGCRWYSLVITHLYEANCSMSPGQPLLILDPGVHLKYESFFLWYWKNWTKWLYFLCRLLVIGYWLLTSGNWLLAIGYWLWAMGYCRWLFAIGYWLLSIGCGLLAIAYVWPHLGSC